MEEKKQSAIHDAYVVHTTRRNALKFLFLGGGSFLLGVFLTKFLNIFSYSFPDQPTLKDFNFIETEDSLKLYTKTGEEIMVIDKKSL
ncbi:MAG: hypothetical protein Q8R36_04515 [bacterium]|nr:hypothetical protein [bacterium]